MAIETTVWDPVDRLETLEAQEAYLEAAFEDGDPDDREGEDDQDGYKEANNQEIAQ